MMIWVVQHGNMRIEFKTQEDARAYAIDHGLGQPSVTNKIEPDMSIPNILDYIEENRSKAGKILADIYAVNTVNGITTAQSDQLFEEFADVILRIREGAFSTAIYRLQQKSPVGFATQDMIDQWILIIQSYL